MNFLSRTFKKMTAILASLTVLTGIFIPMFSFASSSAALSGTVHVDVDPDAGSYIVYNNVTGDIVVPLSSGDKTFTQVMGDYRIEYQELLNFTTPAPESFTVVPGGFVTLLGSYQSNQNMGTVNVVVSPTNGKYEIRNSVTQDIVVPERTGARSFTLPYNDYLVDFKDIGPAYVTPDDIKFTLDANNPNLTIEGIYESPIFEGTITVNVSPSNGEYVIKNAATKEIVVPERTGSRSYTLPYNDYVVEFQDIGPNYQTPEPQNAFLNAATPDLTINATYAPINQMGKLDVIVSPATGTYVVLNNVTGDTVVSQTTGTAGFSLPFGDYRVVFQDISPAYYTPSPVALTLDVNNPSEVVNGVYTTVPATGTVVINVFDQDRNPITDADWSLSTCANSTGPCVPHSNGAESVNLPNVSTGRYGIDANLTPGYSSIVFLSEQRKVLNAGDTIVFNIQYIEDQVIDQFANVEVTTTPVAGEIRINGNVVGTPGAAGDFIPLGGFPVDVTVTNTISFGPVGGYTAPDPIVIDPGTLTAGDLVQYTGVYEEIVRQQEAILEITTTPVAGEIFVDGVSQGTLSVDVNGDIETFEFKVTTPGDYTVSFGDVTGYRTPADQTITVTQAHIDLNTYIAVTGVYVDENARAILEITTTPVQGEISVDGVSLGLPPLDVNGDIDVLKFHIDTPKDYMVSFAPVAGYITPLPQQIRVLQADIDSNRQFQVTGVYTPVNTAGEARLEFTTTPVVGEISVDGTVLGTPTAPGVPIVKTTSTPVTFTVSYADVAGYITPADQVITVDQTQVDNGDTISIVGEYTAREAVLAVSTTPVVGFITVTGDNGFNFGGTPTGADTPLNIPVSMIGKYQVTFGDVAGYTTPDPIEVAIDQSSIDAGTVIPLVGVYTVDSTPMATIVVTTNIPAPITVDGAVVGISPVTLDVDVRTEHRIEFPDIAGYIAPASIRIDVGSLSQGTTSTYHGEYLLENAVLTISKTATEQVIANNNKRVDYTIRVERVMDNGQPILVNLNDTMTGSGSLSNNGGIMNYVPNTFSCAGVSCQGGNLADQSVQFTLDSLGSFAEIKYQMLSSNAGQTTLATLNNTATAQFEVNGNAQTIQASHQVTVDAAPGVQPPNNGGGGGGGGGSHRIFRGDFGIDVTKYVSVDGENFYDASTEGLAVIIPENQDTRLTFKVKIHNPNRISARDITYKHFFAPGESDMTAGTIEAVRGAELDEDGNVYIKYIRGNQTQSFTYQLLVSENGENPNAAIDGVELVHFVSGTMKPWDGHTYLGIGDKEQSYIKAGDVQTAQINRPGRTPSSNSTGGVLPITLQADKSAAEIGEMVNYILTLTNNSDEDMTNLMVAHSYPEELEITSRGGGQDDGRELTWGSPILRPGDSLTYRFQAKVVAGQAGQRVRSHVRAMVSQFENVAPAESYLTIIGGIGNQPGRAVQLAATGPGTVTALSLLSILAYYGYGALGRKRYELVKAAALQPL